MGAFLFPASGRLKSKRLIDSLFSNGKGGLVYPVRYIVEERKQGEEGGRPSGSGNVKEIKEGINPDGAGVKVLVSVSKRYHKRAVVRNLLKRRMREAYRIQKQPLTESGKNISLGLMYASGDVLDYKEIEDAIGKIIAKICRGS